MYLNHRIELESDSRPTANYSPTPQSRQRVRHAYFNLRDKNFQCVITGTVGEVRALSLTALVGTLYGQWERNPLPPFARR